MAACAAPVPWRPKPGRRWRRPFADDLTAANRSPRPARPASAPGAAGRLGDRTRPVALGKRGPAPGRRPAAAHRMCQHLAPGRQDLADHAAPAALRRWLHGGLQHGEDEAFHPVAVEPEVAPLPPRQAGGDGGRRPRPTTGRRPASWVRRKKGTFVVPKVSSASRPTVVDTQVAGPSKIDASVESRAEAARAAQASGA